MPDIERAVVDAGSPSDVARLISECGAGIVINAALPAQNLPIMDACLEAGAHYIDTSAPEPVPGKYEMFAYKWQFEYHGQFAERGLTALLSIGFDPGVTNVFCAYAAKHLFDEIHEVDILDCNGGTHGHAFATNFDPVTNIQEVTQPGYYWDDGEWIQTETFAVTRRFKLPEIGVRDMYLIYHEELETLVGVIPGLRVMRFWMHFTRRYLDHIEVLQNVGLTSLQPVPFNGLEIRPLEFLEHVLPDPAQLGGEDYKGKTNIGCLFAGVKDGVRRRCYLYNVCDHLEAYREVGSQAVSYTAGVPPVLAAQLLLEGAWARPGVITPEQLDPDPFMDRIGRLGLPWVLEEKPTIDGSLSSGESLRR